MTRKLLFTVLIVMVMSHIVAAQTSSGQLCVRAFEDRNANGTQDPNEPPIVRGVSATLSDGAGVIVDTALMESSSSASNGTLCFQRLEAGQYRIRVASADYVATTPNDFTAVVSETGVPQVLSFGGQFIPVEMPANEAALQEERLQATIAKAVVGGIGALVVMGAMIVIGAIIYFFVLRNRSQPSTGAYRPVPATGAYQPVPGTGQFPAAQGNTPPTGSMPAAMDQTDIPDVTTVEDTYAMYSDDDDDTNKPAGRPNGEDDSPYRPPNE